MRTLWTIASILAVAHMLALLGVVGWLQSTDRLDKARVLKIRDVFATTVTAERTERETAEEAAKLDADAQAREGRLSAGPMTAEEMIHVRTEQTEIDRQRLANVAAEIDAMRRVLASERLALDAAKAAHESERSRFESERARIVELEGDAQLRKSVGIIEGLKADAAKKLLLEVLASGPNGRVDAVSYLNAADEQVRTRILAELVKSDPRLAAELLTDIRQRGQGLVRAGAPANDPADRAP